MGGESSELQQESQQELVATRTSALGWGVLTGGSISLAPTSVAHLDRFSTSDLSQKAEIEG